MEVRRTVRVKLAVTDRDAALLEETIDEFRCENDECHVPEFQADINAAANIARRATPWGESLPLKLAGDDSPRDGSARDSTATRSAQRPSRQMTPGERGSEPTAST